jgi:hypothetical protein
LGDTILITLLKIGGKFLMADKKLDKKQPIILPPCLTML